jgi:hypothetical protein
LNERSFFASPSFDIIQSGVEFIPHRSGARVIYHHCYGEMIRALYHDI